jgi:protein TonB
MDFLYRFRQFLSGPPAIIIAVIIVTTPITKVIERLAQKDDETPINLNEPPPPPPPPPKEEPKDIKVEPREIQPVAPAPDVITKDSVVTEIRPPAPEPPRDAVPRAEVASGPVNTGPTLGQIQAGYETIIRRYLESIKRYPTSREARLQRPTGKVGVWLEVNRDGSLKDAGIAKSADSLVLDNAALSTIRNGKYPPFPPEAYPGESSHRFTLTLEYTLEVQN